MTLDQFFKRLEKVPGRWELRHFDEIRKTFKRHETCPICAVAGRSGSNYEDAAHRLGLRRDVARRIACAADVSFHRVNPLRRRLLKACRLKEAE